MTGFMSRIRIPWNPDRCFVPLAFLLILFPPCYPSNSEWESESDSPITLFESSGGGGNVRARLTNLDSCREIELGGETYLEIEKDTDPYSRVQWAFRFEPDPSWWNRKVVFEIRFFDRGAGILDPVALREGAFKGTWQEPIRQGSYTRLNTNQVRSAFFEFDLSETSWQDSDKPHLLVAGLQYLKGLAVHTAFSEADWEQVRHSIPEKVGPMVRLERPLQLVTSAGVNNKGTTATLIADLVTMEELVPLAKVLGFTSIESYVRWDWLEPEEEGKFDFRWMDGIVEKIRKHDLKWFPLLVVGSAYSLPKWFIESEENVGFVCLEHGLSNPIQSIWSPYHKRHVTRVLRAFGERYEPMGVLEGVRLGPSGNYGESQYPAGGNWPMAGEEPMHIHIGYWAGDKFARADFRRFIEERYGRIEELNRVWETDFKDFSEIEPELPVTLPNYRRRLDITEWYTDSMTEWCDWWVEEAGKAMPRTKIYQSSGGWGFRESGTDYSAQTKSMLKVNGGIRLTNETDSFDQNFFATRLAATAARLYGVDLGYEPASSHTARGVVGRLFNTAVTNGDHFFTYYPNVMNHPFSIEKWLENSRILDKRQDPVVDVAVYYPETMNQLEDAAFRHLYAWGFNPRAREIRRHIEVDYLDERLIREGFLDRYKVLVHAWGDLIEADVLEEIDRWARAGGVLIFPSFPRGSLETIEGDKAVFREWVRGNTGQGSFYRYQGDMEPPSLYGDYVREVLSREEGLHPWTKKVLEALRSDRIFMSVQEDGHVMVLNYGNAEGFVEFPGRPRIAIQPYDIERIGLDQTN